MTGSPAWSWPWSGGRVALGEVGRRAEEHCLGGQRPARAWGASLACGLGEGFVCLFVCFPFGNQILEDGTRPH